jgi:hypothetical protein
MLMASRKPDPDRPVEGTTLRIAIERLALRAVKDSGGTTLRALADIRAAVDAAIERDIANDGSLHDPEILFERVVGARRRRSWREIGDDLGVSAQAAHRKYARLRRE